MKKLIAVLIIVLLLAAGCRKTEPVSQNDAAGASAAASAAAEAQEGATETGDGQYAFTFTAQTLDGETVTQEFFGRYDLTMINVWASWCPPCRGELDELAALYGRLPENVGFLSVTVDDPADLATAADLLKQHGCAFSCLDGQGSEGLMKGFLSQVQAIPATLFLDGTGNQVGKWIVGVPQGSGSVSDAYMTQIEKRLGEIGKS